LGGDDDEMFDEGGIGGIANCLAGLDGVGEKSNMAVFFGGFGDGGF